MTSSSSAAAELALNGHPIRHLEPRIWVDDAHPIFRRGLCSTIEAAGCKVAGESTQLEPLPDLSESDILLFELRPGAFQQAARAARDSGVKLVCNARVADEQALLQSIEAGIAGFTVREDLSSGHLLGCLQAVAAGNATLPTPLLAKLVNTLSTGGREAVSTGNLTERELRVLRLLATGDNTREIAAHLAYSERTVKNIVHEILLKLSCRTRTHAVAVAARQGLI